MEDDKAPPKVEEASNLDIYYKFYLEGEPEDSIIKKDYYLISIEKLKQLTRENLKDILIEDGYNPKYLESIKEFKYFYTTKEDYENISGDKNIKNKYILDKSEVLKKVDNSKDSKKEDNTKDLKEDCIEIVNGKNQLYLHIIINKINEENKNKEEKEKEEYDIKTQLSNIQQISNEIREINKQIINLNQKKDINEEEKNSEGKNIIQNEKNDSNKTTNTNKQSKKILYFILEDEFYEKKEGEIKLKPQLNNNFYLTQKLKTLIPSNFDVKFKIFNENDNFNNFFVKENDLINISFLYLGSKRIKDKVSEFLNQNEGKVGIKILILGYIVNNEDFTNEFNQGIKNIIFIPKNEKIDFTKSDKYSNKTYNYYFKNYFIEFVHEFMSQLTTKCDYCPINDAFNTVKRNFVSKVKRIFNETLEDYELIKLQSPIEDDNFDNEVLDIDDILNNDKKIINDIYDQYEYEYNKIKNIYYRKNPFSEETHVKKRKYETFMQLPGIEKLKPKNFLFFVEKDIYNAIDDYPKLVEVIENIKNNTNINNIYDDENVFDLGDELCKYFYMQGNFPDGIYIVSPSFIEEEMKRFISERKCDNETDRKSDSKSNSKSDSKSDGKTDGKSDKPKILFHLKLLDTNNKENVINHINEVTNEKSLNGVQFIISSEEKIFDNGISLKKNSEIKINN